jgi:hypothetical protein
MLAKLKIYRISTSMIIPHLSVLILSLTKLLFQSCNKPADDEIYNDADGGIVGYVSL